MLTRKERKKKHEDYRTNLLGLSPNPWNSLHQSFLHLDTGNSMVLLVQSKAFPMHPICGHYIINHFMIVYSTCSLHCSQLPKSICLYMTRWPSGIHCVRPTASFVRVYNVSVWGMAMNKLIAWEQYISTMLIFEETRKWKKHKERVGTPENANVYHPPLIHEHVNLNFRQGPEHWNYLHPHTQAYHQRLVLLLQSWTFVGIALLISCIVA